VAQTSTTLQFEDYPRPSVTADTIVLRFIENALHVLLIQRKASPFEGKWALPGGFVNIDEGLDAAAKRELNEETGLANIEVEQLQTFGDPARDPRGRVISIAYLALLPPHDVPISASDDAADVRWFVTTTLPPLAFDHELIVLTALERVREKVSHTDTAYKLLPREFALSELQALYEAILGLPLDKRNFRRRVLQSGKIQESGHIRSAEGRPARLYLYRSAS
jgi:8-oxo-dGTP diphosphatase